VELSKKTENEIQELVYEPCKREKIRRKEFAEGRREKGKTYPIEWMDNDAPSKYFALNVTKNISNLATLLILLNVLH
jgi:hypothetical protein